MTPLLFSFDSRGNHAHEGHVTEYQRQLIEILVQAKYARTDEERTRLFRTAEDWSERARRAEQHRGTHGEQAL